MNGNDYDRMKRMLKQALPPIEGEPEPERDLWPGMLRRLDEGPVAVPWFDWALLGGLVGMAALFPPWIPLLLYYL